MNELPPKLMAILINSVNDNVHLLTFYYWIIKLNGQLQK